MKHIWIVFWSDGYDTNPVEDWQVFEELSDAKKCESLEFLKPTEWTKISPEYYCQGEYNIQKLDVK